MSSKGGNFEAVAQEATVGTHYLYRIDGRRERPDPRSRWQPKGVHGPSCVVDPAAFVWSDANWHGHPLRDYVLYELHVGTFSPEGTLDGIIPRLGHLRDLGVTAIELMPVAEFAGHHGWGYDGVCWYAPHSAYGGPPALRRLVDACHAVGLAVVLDVVYNHLGPEGNYLAEFAPYFTELYRTPWGQALNFDGPDSGGVRRHVLDNVRSWFREYHVDALRLDAIHGIFDFGARHILAELAETVEDLAQGSARPLWLFAESDLNDARVLRPKAKCGHGIHAQWNDDFHHAVHAVLSPDRSAYFADFGGMADVQKAITHGFVYDGGYSAYRRRRHGSSSADLPGEALVMHIENHDQIANADGGQRLATRLGFEAQKLAAALLAITPALPLLFMGQEYGETNPFWYFTSHGDPLLARAVREGRVRTLAAFAAGQDAPDPQSAQTFEQCKLDWAKLARPPHSGVLRLYRDLLALRRQRPCLGECRKDLTTASAHEKERWLVIVRGHPSGGNILFVAHLAGDPAPMRIAVPEGKWRRLLWTGDARYDGPGQNEPPGEIRGASLLLCLPFAAVLYEQNAK